MIKDNYESDVVESIYKLFSNYGYKRYKLSSFEEYSLYQQNKDFLLSKNVITFSDLSGRLLAMRPDVTLSVIRHNEIPTGRTEKLFYSEKVYRQAVDVKDYKEISQTGVEVFGAVDETTVIEAVLLALKTLGIVGENFVLDISHMGYIEGLLSQSGGQKRQLLDCLKRKDLHDYNVLAEKFGYSRTLNRAFKATVNTYGNVKDVLNSIKDNALNEVMYGAAAELELLYLRLSELGFGDKMNIDFSSFGNADYYNGVVFNGYIEGVPHRVLSGGRYDRLLEKFNKRGAAIGFALYFGEIERYFKKDDGNVDYLIIYSEETADKALKEAERLVNGGCSVRLSPTYDESVSYKNLIDFSEKESK